MHTLRTFIKLDGTPFEDEKAKYILDRNLYILKDDWVDDELFVKLEKRLGTGEVQPFLIDISRQIRNAIKTKSLRANWDITEYLIAKNDQRGYEHRELFIEACLLQIRYALRSGGNTLGDAHGVNLKTGTTILDWSKIRGDIKISSEVMEVLTSGIMPLINESELLFAVDPIDYRGDY